MWEGFFLMGQLSLFQGLLERLIMTRFTILGGRNEYEDNHRIGEFDSSEQGTSEQNFNPKQNHTVFNLEED